MHLARGQDVRVHLTTPLRFARVARFEEQNAEGCNQN